jgi:hypothetical protein
MKQLTILGLADTCSLCLEADGRKQPSRPVFVVSADMQWTVCGPHLAALVKAAGGEKPTRPAEVKPAQAVPPQPVPVGNGSPKP